MSRQAATFIHSMSFEQKAPGFSATCHLQRWYDRVTTMAKKTSRARSGFHPVTRTELNHVQEALKRLTDMVQVVLPTVQRIARDHDLALLALKRMAQMQTEIEALQRQVTQLQVRLKTALEDHDNRLTRA
jgi:hypothetical protein